MKPRADTKNRLVLAGAPMSGTAYPSITKALEAVSQVVNKEIDDAVAYAVRCERKRLEGIAWWCEACDEPHKCDEDGGGYFSADDCNATGRGVVLCSTCCDQWNKRVSLGKTR